MYRERHIPGAGTERASAAVAGARFSALLLAEIAVLALGWVTDCVATGNATSTNDPLSALMPPAPKRRPLVVMKQTTIKGRLFFLTEEDGEGKDSAAAGQSVEVYVPGETESLCKTKTEKDGYFTLPNLDVGRYVIKVGRLMLDLLVKEPPKGPTYARRIPKTILIFIPQEMKE